MKAKWNKKKDTANRSCWLFFSFSHKVCDLSPSYNVSRSIFIAMRWGQLSAGANKLKIEKRALSPLNNTVLFIMITIGSIFSLPLSYSEYNERWRSVSIKVVWLPSRESNFMNYFSHFIHKLHVTKCFKLRKCCACSWHFSYRAL